MRNKLAEGMLAALEEHRKDAEADWNKSVEVDAPDIERDALYMRAWGVEECVQIARAWVETHGRDQARADMIHDAFWAIVMAAALICGMMILWR
jgi:NTP pyrophosphatase (non-canonical NTP hydrolase)